LFFGLISDEISRQLKDSSTKAIVTFVELFQLATASANVVQAPINILTIKTEVLRAQPPIKIFTHFFYLFICSKVKQLLLGR
jgi:hypothetical protein